MLRAVDAVDWPAVRRAFADAVEVDYTSLVGGQPARVAADQLIATWQALVPGFEATQHKIGPINIVGTGDQRSAETDVRGYHEIKGTPGGDAWIVVGKYTFQLSHGPAGWRITGMKLTVFYQEGNLGLPAIAQERAKSAPRRAGVR